MKSIAGLSVPCNDSPITPSSGTTLNCVNRSVIVAKVVTKIYVTFKKENT